MEGIKISYSRVSSYLSCAQKHYFNYVEKLKPKGVVRPLMFGGDFHKLLELRYDEEDLDEAKITLEDTYNDLTPSQQSDIGDDYLEDLYTIFDDYNIVWEDAEEPVETEHEFLIKVGSYKGEPVYFHGLIDEIYEDGTIGDHKTFSKAPDMGILAMNMQSMLYAKAREIETGEKPRTMRWDYIKSTPAKKPIWLAKSNKFSLATNSNITDLSWLRACEELGVTDKEMIAQAELYKPNRSNFFFKTDITIVPEMVDSAWKDFKEVCKDIAKRGETNKVKNISRDCSWCNYRAICFTEFTGGDVDYVKETDYKSKEENDNDRKRKDGEKI